MMRTGPPGDRGALRGRAHFLSFLSDEERCCLFTSTVTSPCRNEAFPPFSLSLFLCVVADALLMSLFRGRECRAERLLLADWLGAGHGSVVGKGRGWTGCVLYKRARSDKRTTPFRRTSLTSCRSCVSRTLSLSLADGKKEQSFVSFKPR